MISCNEIKLEDMTVTSQSNIPNSPAVATTEKAQVSRGNTIHRTWRKMIHRVRMRKITTPTPKTRKSFLTKVIRSSAIMGTPPRKSSAWSR